MAEVLITSSAALAKRSGVTVFGAAVMISPVRLLKQRVPHMPAQVAIGDDAYQHAVGIDDAETAEGLLGHDHHGLGHDDVDSGKREPIALMHQIADEFQPGAELAAGMQRLEVDAR